MRNRSRISVVSVAIVATIFIIIVLIVSWMSAPKAKVTTDSEGNKTIETPQETAPKTDMKEATPEVQEKYVTSDVKIVNQNGFTVITGKIKNNDSSQHNVSVQVNFYNEKNRIAGSADTLVNGLKTGETRDFKATVMGDLTKNRSEVKIEFIN